MFLFRIKTVYWGEQNKKIPSGRKDLLKKTAEFLDDRSKGILFRACKNPSSIFYQHIKPADVKGKGQGTVDKNTQIAKKPKI